MTFDCCIKQWLRNKNMEWNASNIMKSFKKCLKKENKRKKYFLTSELQKTVTVISKKSFKLSTRDCHNFIVLVYQWTLVITAGCHSTSVVSSHYVSFRFTRSLTPALLYLKTWPAKISVATCGMLKLHFNPKNKIKCMYICKGCVNVKHESGEKAK